MSLKTVIQPVMSIPRVWNRTVQWHNGAPAAHLPSGQEAQSPYIARDGLAKALDLSPSKVRSSFHLSVVPSVVN